MMCLKDPCFCWTYFYIWLHFVFNGYGLWIVLKTYCVLCFNLSFWIVFCTVWKPCGFQTWVWIKFLGCILYRLKTLWVSNIWVMMLWTSLWWYELSFFFFVYNDRSRKYIGKKNNSMEYIAKKKALQNRSKYPNQTEPNRLVWFGSIFQKQHKPNQTEPIEYTLVRTLDSSKTDPNRSNYTPMCNYHFNLLLNECWQIKECWIQKSEA
jgi:hypothetical protein